MCTMKVHTKATVPIRNFPVDAVETISAEIGGSIKTVPVYESMIPSVLEVA